MEKINVAELLKDCPIGMELDCTMYDNVTLYKVDLDRTFPILLVRKNGELVGTTKYGQYQTTVDSKCIIFPKGKTTWEGFHRQFKDGDIVFTTLGNIAIIRKPIVEELFCVYGIMVGNGFYKDETTKVVVARLATEEEKQKLFNAIKENGYKWNAETKTLEKLIEQKFDITTLKPFDKVLVRDSNKEMWCASIFSHTCKDKYFCVDTWHNQCITYEANKELLGTTNKTE